MLQIQKESASHKNLIGGVPQVMDYGYFTHVLSQQKTDIETEEEKPIETDNEEIDLTDLQCYIIMPLYGKNLEELFQEMNYRFSKQQACGLGIQILNILEKIHGVGYIFNDLKLDNLLLDFGVNTTYLPTINANFFDKLNINIIDFGFATSYIDDKTKEHIKKG